MCNFTRLSGLKREYMIIIIIIVIIIIIITEMAVILPGWLPQMRGTSMVCYLLLRHEDLNLNEFTFTINGMLPGWMKNSPLLHCHGRDSNLRPPAQHDHE